MGIDLDSQVINYLLFADDIVLLWKSNAELQALLNITADFATKWNHLKGLVILHFITGTADFATKWNLKFNSDKSKVMVTAIRQTY